ncbi:MAG: hypothetical protein WA921_14770 [Ahrensia sp.]
MTNTSKPTSQMTRRTLLAASAATAALAATAPSFAAIGTAAVPTGRTCSTLHPLIGQNLAMFCDDASVSQTEKNLALRSTHCPECAVQITPFGASVGHVRLQS